MAKNKTLTYLGFKDELINESNRKYVNYATNKVGGTAVNIHKAKD